MFHTVFCSMLYCTVSSTLVFHGFFHYSASAPAPANHVSIDEKPNKMSFLILYWTLNLQRPTVGGLQWLNTTSCLLYSVSCTQFWHSVLTAYYIYIYAFSRHFYPKRLTLHSSYSFYILSTLAFPGNRTHDLGVASTMLYQLSYRKAARIDTIADFCNNRCSLI